MRSLLIFSVIALISLLSAGCISLSVGEVGYSGGRFSAAISNAGDPSDAYVQITIYRVKNLHQEEIAVLGSPVTLQHGENTITIPGTVEPGQYKLYVYLTRNGSRKTAVIRDIEVK